MNRAGKRYQIDGVGDSALAGVEHMQPQGLHFRAPAGAEGIAVQVGAVPENVVLLGAQAAVPARNLQAGEGGLHYLGAYKVFLDKNGLVHLGTETATNFVALANLVDARLAAIVLYINNHTHASNGTPPSPLLASQATVAATKVKAV